MAEKTYTYDTGVTVSDFAAKKGDRALDRKMAKIWRQARKMNDERAKLEQIISDTFGAAYEAACADGRKQITIVDPTQLRRLQIKKHSRISLNDTAWEAKTIIDNYIDRHIHSSNLDPSSVELLDILKEVFTGNKTLSWNTSVQKFTDREQHDPALKEAKRIILEAKQINNSREYNVLEERTSRDEDDPGSAWREVARW